MGIAGAWFGEVDASVHLDQSVGPARRQAILHRIEAVEAVDQVFYESSQEAYARFREQFRQQPDLLRGVAPAVLPESFRVRLDDPGHFVALQGALCRPGTGAAGRLRRTPGLPPASFRVALRDPRRTAAFVDAFCHSRRTGDCFRGVAMVVAHPRR
jgi:hypothetical protein